MKYLLLVSFLFSIRVQAQELYEVARSIRSLGMGGAYIAVVKDSDALYYNPAALGRLEGLNIQLINMGIGTNIADPAKIEAFQNIDGNDPNTYNDLFGERFSLGATGKASVALPYIGLGYFTEYQVSLELHNPAFPEFETYFVNDEAYILGGAIALGPVSYLGMNFKRMNRWGGSVEELGVTTIANATDLQAIGDNFQNKGTGYGIDLALLTELPIPFSPTLTLVWQNVGDVAFTQTAGTDAPPHIRQNLSLGGAVGFDLPGLDWVLTAEARHLLDSDIQIGKKLHIGTEISIPFLDFRAGFNQGYLSYGVGMNFLLFRIDAVSYTEELGVYPGQTADNRYMIGLSIDLGFDANFNFQDNNGKRRKLKQRR